MEDFLTNNGRVKILEYLNLQILPGRHTDGLEVQVKIRYILIMEIIALLPPAKRQLNDQGTNC